ncbi:MAG: alpha/beta fold hydrolase [Rhodothermales bacterium]|nr:alpha/beta fold hydrolase [Rhodothermales bacterium]MBO6780496.1 alpha/beta fold hydrolase [Rhodothermales bacterium]
MLRWLVAGYLLALVASGIVRFLSDPPSLRPYQTAVHLPPVEGDTHVEGDTVRLAYADQTGDGPTIVLLHGSPVASSSMMDMHEALGERGYRVLTPDLPGFERSTQEIPDYSVRAHGRYLLSWLDSLDVPTAHVVAYSMAGGVALEGYRMQPERFSSVVMLSAIGVQELELTGTYLLNHAIHGLQLSALWLLREATPHFGWLDDAILGVPYARNFYETDQRPLRGILKAFEPSMLIIHGRDDPLVPYAAAVEHYRLVPQSELSTFSDAGHSFPFALPDTTAALVASFVDRVESGQTLRREAADSARVRAAARPFDPDSVPPPGGFTLFVLMSLVAVATLGSEDLATIGAGLMAARGTLTFLQAFLAALAGIVIGDVGLYALGRWAGRPLISRRPFRWFVSEERLRVGEKWFDERGIRAVLVSRFIPGTRLPTYLAAGVLKAPFGRFLGYFLLAALLWTPALVALSMWLGQGVLQYYERFEAYALWVLFGLVVTLIVATRLIPLMATHEGRRRLVGAWKGTVQWEFWPPWAFYPPVVLWCMGLAVRFRHPLAFTAANPGIPHGGLVGESKADILDLIPGEYVADYARIPARVRPPEGLRLVQAFMARRAVHYPLVLKPDVGERGRGVSIAHSDEDVLRYFARPARASIVQRYVPGREFGVFWYRDPDSEEGVVFSVTDKRFPEVVGNGRDMLHRLIVDDDRAIAMLNVYERANAERLDYVPEDGERIRLVELGTHCRGAVFLDGRHLITPALTESMTHISERIDGFHFGRFDLRVPSEEDLAAGTGLQIIELNGVTSEATHIYQPGTSIFGAWATLFRQWSVAYRIGRKNMRAGTRPTGLLDFARMLRDHLRRVLV